MEWFERTIVAVCCERRKERKRVRERVGGRERGRESVCVCVSR